MYFKTLSFQNIAKTRAIIDPYKDLIDKFQK